LIAASLLHMAKAFAPIRVMLPGKLTDVKLRHRANALLPIAPTPVHQRNSTCASVACA